MLRDDKHITVLILVFVGLASGICASAQTDESDARMLQRGHVPEGVWFVPNEGQFHDEVRAEARVYGGDWWLTEKGGRPECSHRDMMRSPDMNRFQQA